MQDYLRRFLIAGIMAVCVGLLFLGVKNVKAETINVHELRTIWMWPADGVITDSFGTRNGHHKGIDIAAPLGSNIYAVDSGLVSKSYYSDTYGNVVFVKHASGLETVYAHMQTRNVQEGVRVGQGEIIGKMGNTGDSSGVHLHFEVHQDEWTLDKKNAINPMLALGEVKIGQAVVSIQKDDSERVVAAAAQIKSEDERQAADSASSKEGELVQIDYIVQKGDTLYSIAANHQTTVTEIQKNNNLSSAFIQVGQKLRIAK